MKQKNLTVIGIVALMVLAFSACPNVRGAASASPSPSPTPDPLLSLADPAAHFAYAAARTSIGYTGDVIGFSVDRNGLTEQQRIEISPLYPTYATVHPTLDRLYVLATGSGSDNGWIIIYDIGTDGLLTERTRLDHGYTPIKIAFAGAYAYEIDSMNKNIDIFSVAGDGSLAFSETKLTDPVAANQEIFIDFTIDGQGRYLYGGVYGSIYQYSIQSDGSLDDITTPPTVAVDGGADCFAFDPSDSRLFVGNWNGSTGTSVVRQYSLGPSGALTELGSPVAAAAGVTYCIAVHPTKAAAYVGRFNQILRFPVQPSGAISASDASFSVSGFIRAICVDSSSEYLLAVNTGTGSLVAGIYQFGIVDAAGSLHALHTPFIAEYGLQGLALR